MTTGLQFVRSVVGQVSDEDADHLLWTCTAFPFIKDRRKLKRQLLRCWNKGGKTTEGALAFVDRELDEAMAMIRRNHGAT